MSNVKLTHVNINPTKQTFPEYKSPLVWTMVNQLLIALVSCVGYSILTGFLSCRIHVQKPLNWLIWVTGGRQCEKLTKSEFPEFGQNWSKPKLGKKRSSTKPEFGKLFEINLSVTKFRFRRVPFALSSVFT